MPGCVGLVYTRGVLRLPNDAATEMVGHAFGCLPEEACGLLVGTAATGEVRRFVPCRNTAASSRVYTIDGRDILRAERDAEDEGLEIIGVMHSHTHTEAYPARPTWPRRPTRGGTTSSCRSSARTRSLRSYRIVDGDITEEPVVVDRLTRGRPSTIVDAHDRLSTGGMDGACTARSST